jgi:low affinity Fe/Cu permease
MLPRRPTHFSRFAKWTSRVAGRPVTFAVALLIIAAWAITGPIFRFSDTWQLVINTGTTIVTFLMVFLIQNTQNRDTYAIQIKLDELIRASKGAHNAMLDLEELEEKELEIFRQRYCDLAAAAREALRQGHRDTNVPEVNPEEA